MHSFHSIALASVSLCTARRQASGLWLEAGATTLLVEVASAWTELPADAEFASARRLWSVGPDETYITPVIVHAQTSSGARLFAGYVDWQELSLTLQRECLPSPAIAMGYALCASDLRASCDRSFLPVPRQIVSGLCDLDPLLATAPSVFAPPDAAQEDALQKLAA